METIREERDDDYAQGLLAMRESLLSESDFLELTDKVNTLEIDRYLKERSKREAHRIEEIDGDIQEIEVEIQVIKKELEQLYPEYLTKAVEIIFPLLEKEFSRKGSISADDGHTITDPEVDNINKLSGPGVV